MWNKLLSLLGQNLDTLEICWKLIGKANRRIFISQFESLTYSGGAQFDTLKTSGNIMFLKRRATLFTVISVFSFASVLILGITLGSEHWIGATLVRDFSKFNLTDDLDPALPLRGFLGKNGIDDSDPGAFRGLMGFGLFSGCKRFNYGLGVRDPSCFTGWWV